MNRLPLYAIPIILESTELPPVIRTEPPYLIGKAMSLPMEKEFSSPYPFAKVRNYHMYILPDGCLEGVCPRAQLQTILDEMAEEYYRLVAHPRYQRFKYICEDRDAERQLTEEQKKDRQEDAKKQKFAKAARELFNE